LLLIRLQLKSKPRNGAQLRTRVQQKSQPRNASREIFVVAYAEIPRALRLCCKLDPRARQEQAQNREKIGATKRLKTTTLSIAYTVAGAGGLEPPNGGIKIQLVRIDYQGAFRKIEEIRPQSVQEVSEYFGMPGHPAQASLSKKR
jgi:hypothetical protein